MPTSGPTSFRWTPPCSAGRSRSSGSNTSIRWSTRSSGSSAWRRLARETGLRTESRSSRSGAGLIAASSRGTLSLAPKTRRRHASFLGVLGMARLQFRVTRRSLADYLLRGCPAERAGRARLQFRAPRRSLSDSLLGAGLAALAGTVLYPLVRYLIPPEVKEVAAGSIVAAKVGELKPNSAKIFLLGGKPAILINRPQGTYKAFSAVCTHLACIVQYRPDLGHIWS